MGAYNCTGNCCFHFDECLLFLPLSMINGLLSFINGVVQASLSPLFRMGFIMKLMVSMLWSFDIVLYMSMCNALDHFSLGWTLSVSAKKTQEFLFNCTEFALCEIDLHSSPQELSKGLCYNFMIQVWIFSLSMENIIEVWIWFVLFIAWKIPTILYWIMSMACSISIGSMQHLKMPKHILQTWGILKSLWWVGLKDTSYWDQLLRHNWSLWCWCWWQSHKIWEVDTLCWVIWSSWWDKSMHSSSELQKWYCPSLSSISSSESP